MFKLATFFSLSLFSLVGSLWVLQTCIVREKDRKQIQEKISKQELAASTSGSYLPSKQLRHNVRKELWFIQEDGSRLQYRIQSDRSLLTLIPIQNRFEVVETLKDIRCWMQDKIYHEGQHALQQVRFIQADEGLYHYTMQQFTAHDVALSLFRLPGTLLPDKMLSDKSAFLKGIAKDAAFTFSGKAPQFQAGEFKATLCQMPGDQ